MSPALPHRPVPTAAHRARPALLPSPLALAILVALVPAAMSTQAAQPAAAASLVRKSYNIGPGPLELVLARFAAAAAIPLSFDPALVAGRQSAGIAGSYAAEEGLRLLLEGSGLTLEATGAGDYTLRQLPATQRPPQEVDQGMTLPVVRVSARSDKNGLQSEGKAEDGYRSRTASAVGALGSMALLDTPFSISVVPQALMQNIQAQSPDDVYKLNPSTRTAAPQASGWSPATTIRGFTSYDTAADGLRHPYNHAASLEDKERVEVLSGLSGFLYGAAAPGGMVNYVSKRPTMERLASVTVGNYGGSQYFVHGDFGGRIDADGRAGYRLNVVGQDGNTAIDDQHIRRELVSAAIDWRLSDKLLLELNAGYHHHVARGATAYWYHDGVPHGAAPAADKLWSQPWTVDEFNNRNLMGRLTYQLNDRVTFRGAYKRDLVERPGVIHTVNSVDTAGEFQQIRMQSGRTKDTYEAASALVDMVFETGTVVHKLTAGYTMFSDKVWGTTYNPNTGWLGPFPLTAPTAVAQPEFPVDTSSPYDAGKDRGSNWLLGDSIIFNAQWSALVGVSHSRITSRTLNESGERTQPDYDMAHNSPSVSLLYKPLPWLTTYASYIEGLERGGVAPDEATNHGENQSPMLSRQRELGVKAEVGGVMLAGALFEIEKAYEYTNSSKVYVQNGRQNHRGLEFSASGKPWDRLTLVGGATLLDTKVKGGGYDGNEPMNVAKVLVKLYSEYALPDVPGLSLSAGIYHTGKQWADEANTDRLPAYTTLDLGARYATRLAGRALTLRINLNNVANKSYWMNSYYVGPPRSLAVSAQMQF